MLSGNLCVFFIFLFTIYWYLQTKSTGRLMADLEFSGFIFYYGEFQIHIKVDKSVMKPCISVTQPSNNISWPFLLYVLILVSSLPPPLLLSKFQTSSVLSINNFCINVSKFEGNNCPALKLPYVLPYEENDVLDPLYLLSHLPFKSPSPAL